LALAWAEDQQQVQSGVGDQRNFGKGLLWGHVFNLLGVS
jgi:hypothetical protein